MTTTITVQAHCASTKEVRVSIPGAIDRVLQDGEQTKVYAYDARVISVKEVEKSAATSRLHDFGAALRALKEGKRVSRVGWNGAGMFVYLVPANQYPASTEVAKSFFGIEPVPYNAYLALKTANNTVSTWAPSGSDALAEDWEILP